jgi:hypothetical protein
MDGFFGPSGETEIIDNQHGVFFQYPAYISLVDEDSHGENNILTDIPFVCHSKVELAVGSEISLSFSDLEKIFAENYDKQLAKNLVKAGKKYSDIKFASRYKVVGLLQPDIIFLRPL